MSVRLTVRQRNEAGAAPQEVLLDQPILTLGRDKSCEVVLAEQAVSRNHARISRDGALFFIEDLGSSYGTQINGKKLPKGEKRLLRDGDTIAIAQYDVTFARAGELAPSREKTAFVARQLVKDVMKGLGGAEAPFLRIMNGPEEGRRIELPEAQELIIGRDARHADVVFDDDLVSRKHVKLRRDWSGTQVEDLESRNGIKVNRRRVNRKTLKDRDELEVGNVRLLYLDPSEVRESPDLDIGDPGSLTVPPPVEEPESAVAAPAPEAASEVAGKAAAKSPSGSVAGAPRASPAPAPPKEDPSPGTDLAEAPDAGAIDDGLAEDALGDAGIPEDLAVDEGPEEPLPEAGAYLDEADGAGMPAGPSRWLVVGVMGLFGIIAVILLILVLIG